MMNYKLCIVLLLVVSSGVLQSMSLLKKNIKTFFLCNDESTKKIVVKEQIKNLAIKNAESFKNIPGLALAKYFIHKALQEMGYKNFKNIRVEVLPDDIALFGIDGSTDGVRIQIAKDKLYKLFYFERLTYICYHESAHIALNHPYLEYKEEQYNTIYELKKIIENEADWLAIATLMDNGLEEVVQWQVNDCAEWIGLYGESVQMAFKNYMDGKKFEKFDRAIIKTIVTEYEKQKQQKFIKNYSINKILSGYRKFFKI